jgi:hypothetical protein
MLFFLKCVDLFLENIPSFLAFKHNCTKEVENPTGVKTACFDHFSCDFEVILMASMVNYFHHMLLIFQMTSDLKMSCWFWSGAIDSFLVPKLL